MSAAPVSSDPANDNSPSGSAGSPLAGNITSVAATASKQSQQQPRSFATAANKPSLSLGNASIQPAIPATEQNAISPSMSTAASSNMAANPVAASNSVSPAPNGAPASGEHSRKPSLTIGASGASGYVGNGGPVAPAGSQRRNINFGQMNADGNPAVANSSPYAAQTSLSTPQTDPRVSSPNVSPSPIPQPQSASGGRPPSGLGAQGNNLNFGSIGASDNELSRSIHAPQGPSMPAQPVHLRRQSSQQSDASSTGMQYPQGPSRAQFMPGSGGRGRGGYQGYGQQMNFSPSQNYRQPSGQQRPGQGGYLPPFQNQGGMPYAGSPHQQARSPMPQGPHPGGPMMPQGQHPGGPMMQHQSPYMNPNQPAFQYPPQYNTYTHHLNPQPGQFGQQPGYDPNYQYYQSPYQAPPPHLAQGAPPGSPRPFPKSQGHPSQYMQGGQYNQPSGHSMSRTPSHASTDRPGSSLGGVQPPPQSQTPSNTSREYPPSQSGTPAFNQSNNQSNFTIPSKRPNKGIVIKDDKGNIVTFDKEKHAATPAPPPVVKSPSPGTTSGAPTPPPAATSAHLRTESKTGKSAEEIKAELRERVLKGLSDDKINEEAVVSGAGDREVPAVATPEPEPEALAQAAEEAEAKAAEEKRKKEEAEAEEEKRLAEARAQAEKEEETKKAAELAKAEEIKAEAAAAEAQAAEEAQTASETDPSKLDEDEELERMIAEMEAKEREEEERERAFAEKKKKEAEEKAAREKEEAAKTDEDLRRAEREAEEAEEARQQQKPEDEDSEEAKAEREKMFASLKKPILGPGAESASGTATPASDDSMPPPAPQRTSSASKSKPLPLKLDTTKNVEPAQPTAGMQSLKSARMLQLQSEAIAYPDGIKSPNPALIHGTKRAGRVYDQEFLMQFQDVFKEKPSVDWEQKLKETIGDSGDSSAGPKSGRTPVNSRAPSNRGPPPPSYPPMGAFQGGSGPRTLPPGTTSQARFEMSNQRPGPTMSNPLANFAGRPGAFPMGNMSMPMARQGSLQGMQHGQSPRNASQRGKSGRQDRVPSRKEQEQQNKSMPLTANGEVKALETSKTGWKPTSVGQGAQASQPLPGDASARMAPDMVQRKVKANLNKMTPERFDKISDEILKIAAQSRFESDGRTLRQVIALTFEKACDEAHWASMYAKFCARMMQTMDPELKDENVVDKHGNPVVGGALFRKYLLNRCQEDFEKGWEMNLPDKVEGQNDEAVMLSDEYYVAAAAKRKGLGLIQFIGELYKLHMLSLRIMHQCFHKLLDFTGMPDESAIESLVKLMRTVGATMEADHMGDKQGSALVDTYFQRIEKIVEMPGLPSRLHFMLLDVIDLRKVGWQSKDDAKGPKTIGEIREEALAAQQQAEMERQRQRVGGSGGGRAPSGRGDRGYPPPVDVSQNRVATEDLRRLNNRQPSRQTSANPQRTLGPTSAFTRSSSGRQGMGAGGNPMNRTATAADDSNSSSRSASRRDDKSNTFSALAGLENEGTGGTPTSSPPVAKATPAANTSPTPVPAAPATEPSGEASKSETTESAANQS